jgi:hypothetical protein
MKAKVNKEQVKKLAEKFAEMLKQELGRDFRKMQKQNASRHQDPKVCASHNWCDANMTMYAAFQEVTGRDTCHSDEDLELWNKAWDYAKEKFLTWRYK